MKHHAILRNQGSRHKIILGSAFKIQYFGAIWSSLKRKTCYLTKHGRMQSFSTIHCLQLALRKVYVWKLRRCAWLRECHGSCQNRTRNMNHKIHKAKKQDHLGNHRAIRKVTEKSVATLWITEYLEYLFLQSSSRIQHARTRSKDWSRTTQPWRHLNSSICD